jgi:cysteinyl-tRNA synthetase
MSKSLGNFFTLRDVFKQFDPMVIRFYYLTHHYRAPLDFSFDDIQATQKSYQRLCRFFKDYSAPSSLSLEQVSAFPVVQDMLAFLCDDLNTPGMLGVLFEHIQQLTSDPEQCVMVKAFLQHVLGLDMQELPEKEQLITPEIERLLVAREKARADKQWKEADALRDELKRLGYEVQDKKIK